MNKIEVEIFNAKDKMRRLNIDKEIIDTKIEMLFERIDILEVLKKIEKAKK